VINWLIFYALFPLLLMTLIYLFFIIYRKSFDEISIGKREIGLLLIGSIFTASLNMPLFIYKNYFLSINVGGALIPLVLSFYLMKENKLGFMKVFIGISIVAIATYMVTVVTNEGVVSYFPFYLFPSILAFLLSHLFYFSLPKAPAYSYGIATLGVIIGGDFSHLPQIFEYPFRGAMGGAGLYDMVYIAGLLSFFLSFLLVKKEKGGTKEKMLKEIEDYLFILNDAVLWEEYRKLELLNGRKFKKEARQLWKKIGWRMRECFPDGMERMLAFILDSIIIISFAFILAIFKVFFSSFLLSFILSFAILQLLYFFFLEYFFNATLGKAYFGIEIRKENLKKADFMDAFTRNVLRFLDMLAFFYIISLILISISPKKQRIGDVITGTVVVRRKCLK